MKTIANRKFFNRDLCKLLDARAKLQMALDIPTMTNNEISKRGHKFNLLYEKFVKKYG